VARREAQSVNGVRDLFRIAAGASRRANHDVYRHRSPLFSVPQGRAVVAKQRRDEDEANDDDDEGPEVSGAGRAGGRAVSEAAEKGLDAVLRSWGEFNSGATAIASELTGYSKQAFNDAA